MSATAEKSQHMYAIGMARTVLGVQAARGVHGSTYNKALASLKSFTPEQVGEMEEAAGFLKRQSKGIVS